MPGTRPGMTTERPMTFLPEELLADQIAAIIGDVRHVAVGNASPIPATAALLARRDSELRRRAVEGVSAEGQGGTDLAATGTDGTASWRVTVDLRREVNRLVARLAARTGEPHAAIHARIRRAVPGPVSAAAGADLLERRRDHLLGLL